MAIRDGGFAGAGSGRLESPGQRPSANPGAGRTTGSMGGYGADRTMGAGFRGPTSTWGSSPSIVAGSALGQSMLARQRQAMSPMAPYGAEFSFTPDEMANAFISEAPVLFGTPTNPSLGQLQKMGQQIQASPELTSMLGSINAPFSGTSAAPAAAPDAGLLSGALDASLPSGASAMSATPAMASPSMTPYPMSEYTYSGPKGGMFEQIGGTVAPGLSTAAMQAGYRAATGTVPASEYARQFFESRGLSPLQSAALVARFEHESSLNPDRWSAVPGESSYGLAQWNKEAGRLPQLQRFAQARGASPSDFDTQLNFVVEEMNRDERAARDALMRAETPTAALNAVTAYERPAGYTRANPAAASGYQDTANRLAAIVRGEPYRNFDVLTGTAFRGSGSGFSSPVQTAALPAPATMSPPPATAAAPAVTPAPVQTTAATPTMPPRSATPGVVQSLLANFLGMPAYSRGASTNAATLGQPTNPSGVANLATGLLASAAPAPAPAAPAPVEGNRGEPFQYVPIELATTGATPVGEVPEVDFSLAMPEWYQQWLQSNSGLLA